MSAVIDHASGTTGFEGGFADPAREGARAFRVVLDALAKPGRIATLSGGTAPSGLCPAAATLLLTLADGETPLWIAPRAEEAALAAWIVFHTGAPRTSTPGSATFALGPWESLLPLAHWPQGTPDYPDAGITLIVEVPALTSGPALRLTGPGIDGAIIIAPDLPEGSADILSRRAAFPLGVDLILVAGDRILGLPRSTSVEREAG
ncbi:MAG: phosphonate C-P lyase system protein PhnH [Pseudomonadota bacterium]